MGFFTKAIQLSINTKRIGNHGDFNSFTFQPTLELYVGPIESHCMSPVRSYSFVRG